jgi:hypothetical protein
VLIFRAWIGLAPAVDAQGGGNEWIVTGRVLDAEGEPVPSATIRAGWVGTGVARSTQSDASGRYSMVLPAGSGSIEIQAERVGFYRLTVEITAEAGERRVARDLRLTPRAVSVAPLAVRAERPVSRPPAAATPGGRDEAGLSTFQMDLPLAPGDLGEIALLRPGVFAAGSDGGVSIAGQPPSQNSVTLDGASFGSTSLPAEALRGTAVVTSTFDPARGQFSGGQIAATTLSGTNLFGGAARLRVGHPALQGGGEESSLFHFDGGAGGALVRHRLFWYGAMQLARRSTRLTTLESAAPGVLRELGISSADVLRLRDTVSGFGFPPASPRDERTADVGSMIARFDYRAGRDHVVTARLDGRGTRVRGLGASPLDVHGGSGELRDYSGGAMVQVASYRGAARNELRGYAAGAERRGVASGVGPAGSVRVVSSFGDSVAGSALLTFGGTGVVIPNAGSALAELSDELVLPVGSGAGRVKVGFVANREESSRTPAARPSGAFTFNSLDDLEAGRPAAYTRILGEATSRATADYGALFAGHMARPHRDLSLIYGMRLEGRRYSQPRRGEAPVFGRTPGAVPAEWGVSPRAGITYEAPSRRWSVRAGAGEFRGKLGVPALAAARGESGATGPQQLACVGPAAPVPDWRLYATRPDAVPAACRDGAPAFAARATRYTLFAPDFGASRTWMGALAWNWAGSHPALGMIGVSADATWSRGVSQPVAWDLNAAGTEGFRLTEEGERAVYAAVAEVDPGTGGIAPTASRVLPGVGTVREVGSGGRSAVAQLSLQASILTSRLDLVFASYTLTHARDHVGSVTAPGGFSEPLSAARPRALTRGPSDLDRRHLLQLQWSRPVHPWPVEVGAVGRLTSGSPYTPRVDGDVNGDGVANDAAFVFDPAAARDAEVAAGMARLLDAAPDRTRRCLREQLGEVARRNSCRMPWNAELDLQANLWPGQELRSRRFTITVTAANVLAGFEGLVHGGGRMRGSGEPAEVDPTLLHVKGFAPGERAFRYSVNPGFGTPAARAFASRPFTLTLQGRWTFGVDPIRQPLLSMFNSVRGQGRKPEQIRDELSRTIPNPAAQVLALADTLRLGISPGQREALRVAADSLSRQLALLADSLARAISTAEGSADAAAAEDARARVTVLADEAQAALDAATREVRRVLTAQQWNRLPAAVQQPSRQILPARGGFSIKTGEAW